MKLESKFQHDLIKELETIFPNCLIMKTDPEYIQGIPDLLVLYNNKWAMLECKRTTNSVHRPNQDYYVDILNGMSFCSFIYPENKEEVLDELQQAFRTRRSSRVSKR